MTFIELFFMSVGRFLFTVLSLGQEIEETFRNEDTNSNTNMTRVPYSKKKKTLCYTF